MFSAATKTDNVSSAANYIEDVFSTWLYTGTSVSGPQTITNGIDLSTKGGLVWIKGRDLGTNHALFDTVRGVNTYVSSNQNIAGTSLANSLTAFNTTGFNVGVASLVNNGGTNFVSWTFREQPKFFDVVTYTGNGVAGRTVAHNLGSAPGFMIVKRTNTTGDWGTYHVSLGPTRTIWLNLTDAQFTSSTYWNNTAPTATEFTVGANADVNANGSTYVAYLFAHDAGGFGTTGSDNVITCGSFTTDGSENSSTTLGYEPQWLLIKKTNAAQDWYLADNMRGLNVAGQDDAFLYPNLSSAEGLNNRIGINSTGFTTSAFGASSTFIYIAIRRGPMKTPTSGTSVFSPFSVTASTGTKRTTGFAIDLQIAGAPYSDSQNNYFSDRLRGVSSTSSEFQRSLYSPSSVAEATTGGAATKAWDNTGYQDIAIYSGAGMRTLNFGRAPGFFDVVCYTETGVARAQPHNLGVVPELIIQKSRSVAADWTVSFNFTATTQNFAKLNLANAALINQTYASIGEMTAAPTATNVNLNAAYPTNTTLVMYLFATIAGVSKVGSYTGTGALQTINCGFAAGARFVLIKRTDSTGDWWVYDSARGITSGNDPYLFLNSTAAQVTGTNYVDTASTGFQVTAAAPAGLNANGGTYIFLAIA